AQSEIRQSLVEAWERIGVLRVQRERALIEMDFRDLNLDQARTLYELEARADLGNNMAEFSAARLRRARAEYQLALTWAEVALLTGHPEWDPFAEQGDS
ncbi:MAG: transporter, partial [Gammaproteobacteria bacterium]